MNGLEFGVMLSLGLVSSLHCVQMCGPLVLTYSVALKQSAGSLAPASRYRLLASHLAYNAGRILTYSALGAIAGLAGGTMGFVGRLAGFSGVATTVAGGLMILAGLVMLNVIPASALLGADALRFASRLLRPLGSLVSSPGVANRFVLGLALGFLPCGLVYAALFKAVATANAWHGALSMFAFGLGTAGSLLALGVFSSVLSPKLNRWGSQLAAVSVMLLGALLLWRAALPAMLMAGVHCHAHH